MELHPIACFTLCALPVICREAEAFIEAGRIGKKRAPIARQGVGLGKNMFSLHRIGPMKVEMKVQSQCR
jgi:hypothetical protein